jgi:capsid assembly protease
LTAYSDIGEAIEAAATDPGIRAILLDVDSSGGEVGGLFDLVDQIQAIRAQCGKPIWAVADEAALSAAYAIACTADRLYVTQTGEVGSIGVVAAHRDESGADAQAGLAWTFIHAGASKVDGNPHQPLSDTARASLQSDVDGLYGRFVDLVAKCRKKSPDANRLYTFQTRIDEPGFQAWMDRWARISEKCDDPAPDNASLLQIEQSDT